MGLSLCQLIRSTFGGVVKKMGLKEGEEWKVFTSFGKPSLEDTLTDMDEVGVEKAIMPAINVWSLRDYGHMMSYDVDTIGVVVEKSNGRIIGGASYNPFRIKESLEEIERGVKEYGFKYVWFHPISYGLRPDDRRCYPLYAKCLELDITVGMQVGHSAEPLTSEPGHPMSADKFFDLFFLRLQQLTYYIFNSSIRNKKLT